MSAAPGSSDKRRLRNQRLNALMRDEIIDDALVLLLRDGRRAMTMDEIADRAEVSTASLYKYFPDGRVELYDRLIDRVVKTDEKSLEPAFDPSKTPVQELTDIGQAYLSLGETHPGYFQLLAQPKVFGPLSDEQAERVAGQISDLIDRVAAVIARGQSGELPEGQRFAEDLDPRKTAEVLHAAWNGLLGLSVRDDPLERKDEDLKDLADLATTIVRRGMLSAPD